MIGRYFAVFVLGLSLGAWVMVVDVPTTDELQREYEAMGACMRLAGQTRCQMTIEDFARYHELQELLDIPPR